MTAQDQHGDLPISFWNLRRQVEADLDAYCVPEHPDGALGAPLPTEWYAERLTAMRAALIQPNPTKMRDAAPTTGELVLLDVFIVVDDGEGGLVAFDAVADEFVLAARDIDPDRARGIDVVSCGVRGDVVGCYLSA